MLNQYLAGRIGPGELVAWLVAVTIAITVHEFSHAKSADAAGDPTPRANGRLTLNPLAHYDLMGSTLFLFFGFGWAKPVPVNPLAFKRPRHDSIMVSLWGPLSNFLTALLFAIPIRLGLTGIYDMPFGVIVFANLALGVFNLIPFGPLDGAHILEGLLSVEANRRLHAFYQRNQIALIILVLIILFVPSVSRAVFGIIFIPVGILFGLLTGRAGLFF